MKMHLSPLALSLLVTVASIKTVRSIRDNTYFRDGQTNPNLANKMYYRDPHLVADDLDRFHTLYIRFETCVYVSTCSAVDGLRPGLTI